MGEAFMAYHPDPLIRDYDDRGMMKWMGFYLSEHTTEMEKEALLRNKVWARKESMNEIQIGTILNEAFQNHQIVTIQLSELNVEGSAFEDIIGSIEGFDENTLYVLNLEDGIQLVPIDSINHIEITEQSKWSCIL